MDHQKITQDNKCQLLAHIRLYLDCAYTYPATTKETSGSLVVADIS